jgi:hypothetical protein
MRGYFLQKIKYCHLKKICLYLYHIINIEFMILPNWFKVFLATSCVIGAMLLFFGMNSSGSVALREVDASIGLIKRPKTSKVYDTFAFIFKPVITAEAVIPVLVSADAPRIIEEILVNALNFLISTIVGKLINKILDFFSNIINKIGGWISTLTGLQDNSASWEAAIALKGYQVTECLNQSTDTVLRNFILGSLSSTENAVANELKADFNKTRNATTACSQAKPGFSDSYMSIKNAVSSIRLNSVIANSQLTQGATLDDETNTQKSSTEGNVIAPSVGEDGLVSAEESGSTSVAKNKSLNTITVEKNNKIMEEIASNLADVACEGKKSGAVKDSNRQNIDFGDISYQSSVVSCNKGSEKAKILLDLETVIAKDNEVSKRVEEGIKEQSASDCRETGGVDIRDESNVSNLQTAIKTDPRSNSNTLDVSTNTVAVADNMQIVTINAEQCNSTNRLPVAQSQVESATASNKATAKTFNISSIIDQIKKVLNELKDKLINKMFNYFQDKINKLISGIGNSYLSTAVSSISGNISSSALIGIQELQKRSKIQ